MNIKSVIRPAGILLICLFMAYNAAAESGKLQPDTAQLQQQAQNGGAVAQYQLAMRYIRGAGVTKNSADALKWLEKSASQNNADAQYMLGYLYSHGQDVTQNQVKAVEFYDKAREQNHAGAQYMLGIMYLEGKHVARNYKYARYLISQACKGGAYGACDTFSRLPEG